MYYKQFFFFNLSKQFSLYSAEAYSEPCQISKVELFSKILGDFQSLTISAKSCVLDLWQDSEYAFV